mgnify:CR=1 FL=1
MGQLGYATMLRIFLQSGQQQLHSFFTLLADPSRYPLLFHCSIGKDRTGLVAGAHPPYHPFLDSPVLPCAT